MSEEHPLLTLLLNERLPELGLDVETYGPYIVALFPLSDTIGDEVVDEIEGWDEILELLQASTEIQDLEEHVWEQLKVDLLSTWRSYREGQIEQQKVKQLEKEQNLKKILELERDMAKMNAEAKVSDPTETSNGNNSSTNDATKLALLNRFAYEEDENDDGDKGVEGTTNKTKAESTDKNHTTPSTTPKHPPVTTKREEQQKTKAAQQQKIDAKEERRKRAMKGERRR